MGKGKTLIVDDEEDMRLLLSLTITNEDRGLRVVGEAASGAAALRIQQELDIDVVVLDQRMPGLSGLETTKALLAEEPGLPIILYSAFPSKEVCDEALKIGALRCIQKGDRDSLVAALREVTGLEIGDSVSQSEATPGAEEPPATTAP